MNSTGARVAIVHAHAGTIEPVATAFREVYPEADLWHLVDDRLVKDADEAGGLTPQLAGRMASIIGYAVVNGADAVQLACSMYGPVASATDQPVPVCPSDRALFDAVAKTRPQRVLVLASLAPAAVDSVDRLRADLSAAGIGAQVDGVFVEGAAAAAAAGDMDTLADLMAGRIVAAGDDVDVVMLAQYSLAPAASRTQAKVVVPVLSGPQLAASALRHTLHETETSP